MTQILTRSKTVLAITLLGALAAGGCNRTADTDTTASGSGGTYGGTSAAGTTAAPGTTTTAKSASPAAVVTTTPSTSSTTSTDTSGSSGSGTGSSGTSADATKGAVGATVADSVLTAKVKAALLADSSIKGTDISVETNKGEVMLSGFVKDQSQIERPVKVAEAVSGVQKVTNKLTVKK